MADLSPELASRIQSLESSFADNPGRYFVALAGAWREAGEPGRAEEILREHLKRFPGLSPHVLLGRCLADRGAWQEASNEFHYVLSIDSQNLIALRTLAEMASAQGRRDEAQRWYNELLAVDPMNAEARQALAGLSRSGADAATLDQPVQVGREWGASGEADRVAGTASGAGFAAADEEFGLIDLNSAPPSAAAQSQAESAAGEWGEISLDAAAPSTPTAHTQPASGGDFDAFAFGSMSLDHGAADEPAAQGLDMPSFNAGPSLDLPALDAGSSLAAEGTGDWVNSDARQDLGESAAADLALPSFSGGMADAPVAGADLPLLDFSGQEDGDADGLMQLDGGLGFGDADASAPQGGAGDHHDHVDAEVVTETMAELYASQGLLARAAEVYRELIQQRGDEPGLVRRLAEIEGRISGQSAAADEDAAPAWLQGVDAFASGTAATTAPAFSADRFEETYQEETSFSTDFSASTPAPAADAAASGFAADLDLTAGLSDASGAAAAAAAPAASFPGSGDPFADSFAGGFDGIAAPAESSAAVEAPAGFAHVPTAEAPASAEVPAPVAGDAGDDRQAWSAPTVTETESEGFDLIVVADDGEEQHIHASAEDVAEMSADWAVAAAPLGFEGDDEEDDVPAAAASASSAPSAAGRTMQSYFASLLTWQPGAAPSAPVPAPMADISAPVAEAPAPAQDVADDVPQESGFDVSTADASAMETHVSDFTVPDQAAALPWADAGQADVPAFGGGAEPLPFDAPADERAPEPLQAPADDVAPMPFDLPADEPVADDEPASVDDFAPMDFGTRADDLPALDAAPWAAPATDAQPSEADPWSAPVAEAQPSEADPWSAPAADAQPSVPADPWSSPLDAAPVADLDLPLDDEPWAAAPAPAAPADLGSFELSDDLAAAPPAQTDDEGMLPWEAPAPPAAPEPAAPARDGFSFEDFFSGPAAPEPAPAPAPAPEPTPSFGALPELEPVPAPAAPPAPPAAQAGTPAGGDEEDEDLESFQAWLQSLKR